MVIPLPEVFVDIMEAQEERRDFYKDIFSGTAHTIFELFSFLVIMVLGNDFVLSLIATIANDKVTITNKVLCWGGFGSLLLYNVPCMYFRTLVT